MQITDIKVRKIFEDNPLRAVVSVTFDDELAVHDIKVVNANNKTIIIMPSKKTPDGTFKDIVHPINMQFREKLRTAILEEVNKF